MTARSLLYRLARGLGDVQAAQRGPGAYAKRRARRVIYRGVNGGLIKAMKRSKMW